MPNPEPQKLPKLTIEQARLLTWLSLPETHLEICRELTAYRNMNGLKGYVDINNEPFKFDTRTLNKLVNEQLVTSEFIYPLGMMYQHYFLTEAGQIYVLLLSSAKGMSWSAFQKR